MRCPSRVSARQRKLNGLKAAKPQGARRSLPLPPQPLTCGQKLTKANLCHCLGHRLRGPSRPEKSAAESVGAAVPNRTSGLRRRPWTSVSSSGRRCPQCVPRPKRARRLEHAASCVQQRGAGCFGGRPGQVTGSWQA